MAESIELLKYLVIYPENIRLNYTSIIVVTNFF